MVMTGPVSRSFCLLHLQHWDWENTAPNHSTTNSSQNGPSRIQFKTLHWIVILREFHLLIFHSCTYLPTIYLLDTYNVPREKTSGSLCPQSSSEEEGTWKKVTRLTWQLLPWSWIHCCDEPQNRSNCSEHHNKFMLYQKNYSK